MSCLEVVRGGEVRCGFTLETKKASFAVCGWRLYDKPTAMQSRSIGGKKLMLDSGTLFQRSGTENCGVGKKVLNPEFFPYGMAANSRAESAVCVKLLCMMSCVVSQVTFSDSLPCKG